MGLDCYFAYDAAPGETAPQPDWSQYYNEPDRQPNLCGGMFSGDGSDGSFRGKVYDEFVQSLTMYTLYDDTEPSGVKALAEALTDWWNEIKDLPQEERADELRAIDGWDTFLKYEEVPSLPFGQQTDEIDWRQVEDLVIMFRAFADLGYSLHAWY